MHEYDMNVRPILLRMDWMALGGSSHAGSACTQARTQSTQACRARASSGRALL